MSLATKDNDVRTEFLKKYNLTETDLDELKTDLEPLRIRRLIFDFGSTHRRDYWSFYGIKIMPGVPIDISSLSSGSTKRIEDMTAKFAKWTERKNVPIHLPISSKSLFWSFEVEHESKVIERPFVPRTPFRPTQESSSQRDN
eukprot:gene16724-19878_t